MINHEQRFIFIHVPKAAGTSIENTLFDPEDLILSPQKPDEIERSQRVLFGQDPISKRYLQHLTAEEIRMFIPSGEKCLKDYFKFTFVRNPWDRAVSEWKWRQKINNKLFGNMSFDSFLKNFLAKRLNEDHFMPQYKYIFDSKNDCMVYFICRFEKINEDFAYVCGRINQSKKDLAHSNQTKRKKHYSQYYTDPLKDLISDIYKKDIKLFQYEY